MNSVKSNCGLAIRSDAASAIQVLRLSIVVFLVCVPLFSQGNQGRITGTITDQSGGVIAGATVTVKDVQRGVSRTLTTGDSGEYNAPNLLPGTYAVRAEARGFKIVERQNILLEVGKEVRVDFPLQPGDTSQTITVTEQLPLVETTNATLGGTLSNETINDLPLNGRNYINLLTLRPGMTVYAGGGNFTRSANGTRAEDIGYLLDGLRNDDPFTGSSVLNAAIPAGDASTSLPIDAIQEFNTEQNPKAEYGWKPGAIVNSGVKSGTNSLHGTAFAFGRDTALDARNFFNQPGLAQCPDACTKSAIGLEQFGASLGGHIKKDKLFYFVNYEGQRYNVADTLISTPPVTCAGGAPGCGLTANDASLSLLDACNAVASNGSGGFSPVGAPGGVTALSAHLAGIMIDPKTGCKIAPPNYTAGPSESLFPTNTNPAGVALGLVNLSAQHNGVAKVDYHINDHHSLSGMYFRGVGGGSWRDGPWEVALPGSSNGPFLSDLWGYVQAGSGAWTWTPNSVLVNEFRVGYVHFRQWYDSNDSHVNPLAYGINTGVTDPRLFGFPLLQIGNAGGTFRLGGNWPKHLGPDGRLQILEHVSVLRGKHAFKFGGEIIKSTAEPFLTANAKGLLKFKSNEDYLTGTAKSSGSISALMTGEAQRHLSNQSYAAFLQDDWRVTPRLTVNLGVRYELTTVLKDRDNKLGNFDPASTTGLVQVGYGGLTSPFHGDHNNFSPRVGFAWDVRGDGKTVIRGGGSIMYEEMPMITFTAVANQLGLTYVPAGARQVYCSAPCNADGSSPQINIAGPGNPNMGVLFDSVPGDLITPLWQNQNTDPTCVTGSTMCGSVFPASFFTLQCGDGLMSTPAGASAPVTDPAPCNTEAVDPNLRTPYVSTWTLTIQRALTNNLSLEVAYVGNHGTKLLGFSNINQPAPGSGFPGAGTLVGTSMSEVDWCNQNNVFTSASIPTYGGSPITCDPGDSLIALEQAGRPFTLNGKFPYLGEIDRLSNLDKSNYNALQATLTQRPTHGLSFLAGYTYSHGLDDGSNNSNDIVLPPDSRNPTTGIYGSSIFDIRHRLTLSTTYAIPGRKGLGQLLQGWELNSVVTLQSPSPWGAQDMSNDFTGTNQVNELNSYGQTWNFFGNPSDFKAGRNVATPCWSGAGGSEILGCPIGAPGSGAKTIQAAPAACMSNAQGLGLGAVNTLNNAGCYFVGNSVLIPPALGGSIGNSGRNVFRDLGFRNWDVSVLKETKFKERLTAQFRAEFFNVLNHANFSDPNGPAGAGFNDPSTGGAGLFGCACNTPDQAAPNPVLGTGGARSIQLGLKLIW
jgi:hypothetical protein